MSLGLVWLWAKAAGVAACHAIRASGPNSPLAATAIGAFGGGEVAHLSDLVHCAGRHANISLPCLVLGKLGVCLLASWELGV
mmetsp:Transcript_34991/g.74109  ORF Transcript_34991/g.74109 Transcript_34991/m.74109 type:complete len:82 (+) Transcript_34991:99-344(+)